MAIDQANYVDTFGAWHTFYGDATQANGAGMEYLGHHEAININPEIMSSWTNSAFTQDVAIAGSLRTLPANVAASFEFYDQQIAQLRAILREHVTYEGNETDGEALVFRARSTFLSTGVLALIPDAQIQDGADAEQGLWLPRAFPRSLTNLFRGGRRSQGADNNPYTVEFGPSVQGPGDVIFGIGPPAAWGSTYSIDTTKAVSTS